VLSVLIVAFAAAAAAPAPTPSALASAAPIPLATPGMIATPASTNGLVLPPAPAIAPIVHIPENLLPSGDVVGTSGPFVGVSLQDAIGMALARNTDLAVSQSNRRIAGWQLVAAEGAYDVQLMLVPNYSYAKTPPISLFAAGPGGGPIQQISEGVNGQAQGLTTSGGQFSFGSSAQRIDNNNTTNSFEPYYQTALSLTYTQPILRGLAIDAHRRQLEIARINTDLSSDNALLQASNTISTVRDAYYDLLAAWKNVAIQEDALLQAKAQSESNARLVKAGAAAPVDVVESDTQVNLLQDNVFSAIQNVATLQNQLKALILSNPADPVWTANLVPVTPQFEAPPEPTLDAVVLAALSTRPEIAQLREQMRSADVDVKFTTDQTKPQLDLGLSAAENGFAGSATSLTANPLLADTLEEFQSINALIARANATAPAGSTPLQPLAFPSLTSPPYTIGGLSQAYASMFSGRYPQLNATLTLGFPIRNRTAVGDYQVALEQRRQLQIQEVALIQRIQTESRNALQAYRAARSRVIAATAARQAAEIVAASELRKFKAGNSTTFLVLQRQVDLANDRDRELQAQTDLAKALVGLDQVTGNVLSRNGVSVTQVGTAPIGGVPKLTP
jgi:HAE1 family hydrophobic/amphiphilic exporter-1